MPLLAIDAWEHAYYLQYKNVKADFFDAIWNVFDWEDVAQKLKAARDTEWDPNTLARLLHEQSDREGPRRREQSSESSRRSALAGLRPTAGPLTPAS